MRLHRHLEWVRSRQSQRTCRATSFDPQKLRLMSSSPSASIPRYVWYGSGGATTLLGGYYALTAKAPVSGRRRWLVTSRGLENFLGDKLYERLLETEKGAVLSDDDPATRKVQRVGQRIVEASAGLVKRYSLPTATPFTFTVIESNSIQAFALPGNHIFVMSGLLKDTRDDELAFVLGHEVAHCLCRHGGEVLSTMFLYKAMEPLSLLVDPSGILLNFFWSPVAVIGRILPNLRVQETEADRIGQLPAAQACYDPRGAKHYFIDKSGSKPPPEILSTHPAHKRRAENLKKWEHEAQRLATDSGRCSLFQRLMRASREADEDRRRSNEG